jgi:N6-adenosine-specific RNA methylase IME4
MVTTELVIDPELRDWIIPLTNEEISNLEKSILEDGCRDPLVVWNGIVVDGHNRYDICKRHNIPFKTVEKSFSDKDEAKLWMVRNQIARRNLEAIQRIMLVAKGEELIRARAKEQQIRKPESVLVNLPKQTPIDTRKESAKLARVSERTYDKGKVVLEKAAPEIVAKVVAGDVSIHKAYTDIRREEKKEERQQDIIENPVIPDGKYNVILADPPWQYQFSETQSREIENQYPTMSLDDISALELPIEDNAVLFLWATAPKLEEAFEVLNAWGFVYKTCAVWDKEKLGMGYWFRIQHELLLVGIKGDFKPPETENRYPSVFASPRSGHSSKPSIVYEMIEKMFPNCKYMEAFARSNRVGWMSWGNQLT